jgi:hypothetical protein
MVKRESVFMVAKKWILGLQAGEFAKIVSRGTYSFC